MSLNSILFISNTITKPLERELKEFNITHAPLDTIFITLNEKCSADVIVILLTTDFLLTNSVTLLKNALVTFREKNSSKIIINNAVGTFFNISQNIVDEKQKKLTTLNSTLSSLKISDLSILDLFTISLQYGLHNILNEKNSYLFQTPFTKQGYNLIAKEIKKAILLFNTKRIKVIAIDADNTLWGGIIGEDGIDGISCDRNYPGIVYTKFQERLLSLKKSGIILILLSKNNEADLAEVFEKKSMPLNLDDFVAKKVNWNSKSENLVEVLKEINITKDDVIFLDDSNNEIEEMKSRLAIKCYKMNPENPIDNLKTIESIIELRTLHISDEDKKKSQLYADESKRTALDLTLNSKDEYIKSLNIEISCKLNDISKIDRITQLINKTNQFNLTTIRLNTQEVEKIMSKNSLYSFSVKDKFGDMGLVGVLIIQAQTITNFLMSCRVLGREIEQSVIAYVCSLYTELKASYKPTSKNSLAETFYESNGFELIKDSGEKRYNLKTKKSINKHIKVAHC
ncbi:MAG: HAD-IIIC family phosphatase [Helicobacteraceae bacterium]|nr:HAD-IIIC family phosphatase [Helicobacteraceae bacterium]